MTVYIAGPMTGHKDLNKQMFVLAEEELKSMGYNVLNPAWLPNTLRKENYLPICLEMVLQSDIVVLLPGWEESAGAEIECLYAKYQGKDAVPYNLFVSKHNGTKRC